MTSYEDYPLITVGELARAWRAARIRFTGMLLNLARFACACGTPTGTLPPSSSAAGRYACREARISLSSEVGGGRHCVLL
jgi:hypothetical protein